MAYWDLSELAYDGDFSQRVVACASTQRGQVDNPVTWADEHRWQVAAAPGFADAFASAIAGGVEHPGRDPSVISDDQILAAVQAELAPPGGTP